MGEFSAFEGGDKAIADEVRRDIAIANSYSKSLMSILMTTMHTHQLHARISLIYASRSRSTACSIIGVAQFSLNFINTTSYFS